MKYFHDIIRQIDYRSLVLVALLISGLLVLLALHRNLPFLQSAKVAPVQAGLPAPDFTLPGLDGKEVSLSDFRGKVVLLNIWATWCPPCVQEMDSLQKLYDTFKQKDFEILAVSIDSLGRSVVAPFMKNYKLTFPALLDPAGTVQVAYQTTGVPESFIIDTKGLLVKKIIGPRDWVDPEIQSVFRKLFAEKATAKRGPAIEF